MHPTNRAERRQQRERVIAARRFVQMVIWREAERYSNPLNYIYWPPFTEWGRYAKWNLGCGCKGCHREKYYKAKSQRRKGRKAASSQVECRIGDRIPVRVNRFRSLVENDFEVGEN